MKKGGGRKVGEGGIKLKIRNALRLHQQVHILLRGLCLIVHLVKVGSEFSLGFSIKLITFL